MDVHIEKRAVRQIRLSAADTIEEGDTEALREDILDVFADHQIDEIEQHLGGTELAELLTSVLEEWSGDDVDELMELLESTLSDYGVVLELEGTEDDEYDDEESQSDASSGSNNDSDFDGFSELDAEDL